VIAGGIIFQLDPAGLSPVKSLNGLPLCLSGDRKTLVVDGLGIVDLAGTLSQERLRLPVAGVVLFADLNADGSVLAAYTRGDKHVTWWDLREKDPQPQQIPCDNNRLKNLKWTPEGQSLILAGSDGIVVWDWNKGQPRERKRRLELLFVVGLAVAPDGLTFATGSEDGRVIIWETATLTPQREWTVPTHVQTVQFAPDGRHLLLGYANGVIEVLRLAPAPASAGS